jgi:SAM-dependent methyltransferase
VRPSDAAATPSARCHVCGRALERVWATATDVEYGTTDDEFRYMHCPDCDCLSIHPLPQDRLAEIYPSTYYSFAGGGDVLNPDRNLVTRVKSALDARTFRRILDLVGEDHPRLLDVGGGAGDLAAGLLRAAGGRATGTVVDFDEDSIEAARARGLEGFVGRFEDFDTDERFHVILMLNLIEHVADAPAMLAKARALLAPTGVVWLQTPNFRSLDARIFRHRNWGGFHCPRHWVIFSAGGLRRALRTSGLEPVAFEHTQAGSFWAVSVLGLRRGRRQRKPGDSALPRPLMQYRSYLPLAAAGAAFDFATRRLRPTSQVVVLAKLA